MMVFQFVVVLIAYLAIKSVSLQKCEGSGRRRE
jgi:hypothetical protein